MTTDPPIEQLAAPVFGWLSELRDPWLQDAVRRRLGAGNLWDLAVGTALYGRLLSGEPEERRRILQALERRQADWQIARPRQWFASLEPALVDRLQSLALAELDAAEEALVTLTDARPDGARGRMVLRLVHRRDDLQAVRVLLEPLRPGGPVAQALNDFDPYAETLFEEMAEISVPFDERLRRISQFGADTWWARLAERMPSRIPDDVDGHVAAAVVAFGRPFVVPLTTLRHLRPTATAAAAEPGAGAGGFEASVVEHVDEDFLVRVLVTPSDDLIVDVRFAGLPVGQADVTLELGGQGRVLERFGPRRTDTHGTATFGHLLQYPRPTGEQAYTIKIDSPER